MGWTNSVQNENIFLLQVMGDKARIMLNDFFPEERELISQVKRFIQLFDELLRESKLNSDQTSINLRSYNATQDFRKFVLAVTKIQLIQKTVTSLSGSYLTVYVTETEIYLNVLNAAIEKKKYSVTAIELVLIWMHNFYLGALRIQDGIGAAFPNERKRAQELSEQFRLLYQRAYIMNIWRKTGLEQYPAMDVLYKDVESIVTDYASFLVDQLSLLQKRAVTGSVTVLELDDFYRIVCYFMHMLATKTEIKPPACDPTTPRLEQ